MTVYVESNFVIEIALGQEQSEAAESILALAENGSVTLAFPTLALEEPFATATQRGRVRQRIKSQINEQIKELSRSRPHQQDAIVLATIALDLEQSDFAERGYFVSKNWKDFDEPGIRGELLGRNCVLVNDFERLLAMVSLRS